MGHDLTQRRAVQGLAVGVQNLHLVHAAFAAAAIGPDDFLVRGDFQKLHIGFSGRAVAGDDGVAVGQTLGAAGIVEERSWQVGVGELPDDFSILVHFDHHVAVGAVDERVAVFESNGGEGPGIFRFLWRGGLPDDYAGRCIFADDLVEQVGDEIVAVGQLAGHAGLHVVIVDLALEGEFDEDFAVVVNFQEAGLWAGFGEEYVAVGERLCAVDFALGAFEFEKDLVV